MTTDTPFKMYGISIDGTGGSHFFRCEKRTLMEAIESAARMYATKFPGSEMQSLDAVFFGIRGGGPERFEETVRKAKTYDPDSMNGW